jgi:predicted enzyme related to lactoylglutathione lyase
MKKTSFIVLVIAASFFSGFAFNSILTQTMKGPTTMNRVTGIGGIFFKCNDPEKIKQWYKTHLGFAIEQYGAKFDWRQGADTTNKGYTLWTPFPEKTKYFAPSSKDFMINYRVENLEALVSELTKEGVTVLDSIESFDEYGKFVHILDIEGNKIELWEPIDK